jgi:hypothetical protein
MPPRAPRVFVALAGLASAAAATPPPSPRTRVVVRGVSDRDGVVAVTIRNAGRVPVALSTELRLQVRAGVRWDASARAPSGLQLLTDCGAPAPACRTLAPGESLRVVPWTGYNAMIQCPHPTPSDFRAPEGYYRVVALECAGGGAFPSAPIARTRLRPL